MKSRLPRSIRAWLPTLFVVALLMFGCGLASRVFGTKFDIGGVTFSMAMFAIWMIFYKELKE